MASPDATRKLTSLALHQQPDHRWTVRVTFDSGDDEVTEHDDEAQARVRLLDLIGQLHTPA